MKYEYLILVTALSVLISATVATDVICYLGTWAHYREGNGKFDMNKDIDVDLCTHIVYAFANISNNEMVPFDSWLDIDLHGYQNFTNLKQRNPNLKTILSIGGWNQAPSLYTKMTNDPNNRKIFIDSVIKLLTKHNFDGFDLDWEYPNKVGGSNTTEQHGKPIDIENYSTLIKELREAFDKNGKGFSLTAAVYSAYSDGEGVDISYDITSLSRYLDRIHIMTYDLHGPWDGITGMNSPLYPVDENIYKSEKLRSLNIDNCTRTWLNRGADPEKIALGLPLYGRTFTLSDINNNKVGAPAPNAGKPGPYTRTGGSLGYNEYCESNLKTKWTEVWDDTQKSVYAYNGNQWYGFDNYKSLSIKAEYAKRLKLGAVMAWSIETDDFNGVCGEKNILLKGIHAGLNST